MARIISWVVSAALLCPLAALAHGPSRLKVQEEMVVTAPPAKVWEIIKDFCAIEKWHPAIAKCEGKGGNEADATRTLTLKEGGGTIEEKMKAYDAATMSYKYTIEQVDPKVLPVSNYQAGLSVAAEGSGSKITWKAGFYRSYPNNNPPPEQSDEAATKAVTGVLKSGLENLKKLSEQ
jgi:carbon monoxide dehydrogenase subunit G